MKKTHVVVTRLLTASECQEIEAMQHAEVFSTEELPLKKYQHIPFTAEKEVKSIQESFARIQRFGYTQINGKPLAEWMMADGISYWYYLRFSLFYWLFPLELEALRIQEISNAHSVSEPLFYTYHTHTFKGQYRLPAPEKKVSKPKLLAKFAVIFGLRFWLGLVNHFRVPKRKNLVINFLANKRKILDITDAKNQRFIYGDYCSEYLLDEAFKQPDFYYLTDFFIPKFDADFSIEKHYFFNKFSSKSLNFEFYLGLKFMNPFFVYKVWGFRKRLKQHMAALSGNDAAENTMLRFCRSKVNLLALMHAREETAKGIALQKQVKSITAYSEYTYLVYSFIKGMKKVGVPGIAFQHGVIHPEHMHYMFHPQDLAYHPLPDYTLLWGEHWRNMLLESSAYAPEQAVVLGQIRTDVIPRLKKESHSEKIILLYASQHNPRKEFRRRLTLDIFNTVAKYPNIKLVIKPHPLETDYKEYFEEAAHETQFFDWECTVGDLYVELSKSDLVLTYNSTVGAEAIYFKKPLLNFDYEDNDVLGYTQYPGAVFKATTVEELDAHLHHYQAGTLPVLEDVQDEFIRKFCYTIDGKASQRYIEFIRQVSDKSVYNTSPAANNTQLHEH